MTAPVRPTRPPGAEPCRYCTGLATNGTCRTCSRPEGACICFELYRDKGLAAERKAAGRSGVNGKAPGSDRRQALPADPEDSEAPGLPDVDLGALAEHGVEPPQLLASSMLYAGGVHCLAGQPGGGKTTVLAWWLLQYIRDGGNVLLLDEESGPELVAEKFLDLGATPDELRPPRFSYIPFPARGWNAVDLLQLHERIAERKPGIIGWDSAAAFLSIAGRDENSAMEVTSFWQKVLLPCARQFGAAVVAIDHTGKGEHGGYGRGSGAKKAASDVQYIVETVRPFNRQQDGLLRLTTSPGKDRRGHLAVQYDIHVRTGGVLALEVSESDAAAVPAADRMAPAKAKLLEALAAISPAGELVTGNQLVDAVATTHGHGLGRQTVSKYMNELAAEGLAGFVDQGQYRPRLWRLAAPAEADPVLA